MDLIFVTVAPLSEYREGSDEEKRCRYALCLCDLDMVRCMGRNKNEIDTTKISYQKCTIKGKIAFQDELICMVIHTYYISCGYTRLPPEITRWVIVLGWDRFGFSVRSRPPVTL